MKQYRVTMNSLIANIGIYEAESKEKAIEMFWEDLNWGTKEIRRSKPIVRKIEKKTA